MPEHEPPTLAARTGLETTFASGEDSGASSEPRLPPFEIDRVALERQQQLILARMFGVAAEPKRMGHYTLLDEIGRGGMGVVYAAHDHSLDRKVAIKLMSGRRGPEFRRRFEREAKAMAKLAHPNVVQVYEIGEADDATFIAMEYVEGVTLRRWLAEGPRTRTEILDTFMAAGRGLAAAHEVGLVHRDFKPDNVMVRADGRVLVMDFGLVGRDSTDSTTRASELDSHPTSADLTTTGVVMGTPMYMAPEQWTNAKVTAQADQFGFCVALWEALHGERPFDDSNRANLEQAVTTGTRRPAKRANVPHWLQQVVERGLELAPERRFGSMQALLDALEADPTSRLLRWGIVLSVVLVLLTLTGVLVERSGELNRGRESKVELQKIEDAARTISNKRGSFGDIHDVTEAIRLADRFGPDAALELGPEFASVPATVTHALLEASSEPVLWGARVELREPNAAILDAAWSPDGMSVATGAANGTTRIWDAGSGASRYELLGHTDEVHTVKFSPDGSLLASASKDQSVFIWDVRSGEAKQQIDDCSGALAFASNGELVTANTDGSATIWDPASGRALTELEGHEDGVRAVAISPDGTQVATAGADSYARVWDAASGALLREFEGHLGALDFVEFSSDGNWLATVSEDDTAKVWDVASGAVVHDLAGVDVFAFSPVGGQMLTAKDATLMIWDSGTGERRGQMFDSGKIFAASFSSDGDQVVTGNLWYAGVWTIGNADSNQLAHQLNIARHVRSPAFSPADPWPLTTLDTVKIWAPIPSALNSASVALPWQDGREEQANAPNKKTAAFFADGTMLAFTTQPETLNFVDVRTGARILERTYAHPIVALAPSQGGGLVAMTNSGGRRGAGPNPTSSPDIVHVWDLRSNRVIQDLTGHADLTTALAIASNREWMVLAGDFSETAKIVRTRDGELLHELNCGIADGVAISPDDKRVLTAGVSDESEVGARIWDADSGEPLLLFPRTKSGIRATAFSPDGKIAIAADYWGSVKMWDTATGDLLGQREDNDHPPIAIGFSKNGEELLEASDDGVITRQPVNPLLSACHQIEATTEHREVAFPCARAELFERRGFVHAPDLESDREDRRTDIGLWMILAAFHVLVPTILLVTGFAASLRTWAAKSRIRPPLVVAACLGPCMLLSTLVHHYEYPVFAFDLLALELLVQLLVTTLACTALLALVRRSPERWWLGLGVTLTSVTSVTILFAPMHVAQALDDYGSILPPTLELLLRPLADLAGAETSRGFPAHLEAHASSHHAVLALLGFDLATLLALYLIHQLWRSSSARFGHRFGFERTNLVTLSFLLASFNLAGLLMLPLATLGLRQLEREADRAALDQTHDNRGCATAAVVEGRGRNYAEDMETPFIEWDLKQGPIEDRIDRCNHYRPWDPKRPHFYDAVVEVARKW